MELEKKKIDKLVQREERMLSEIDEIEQYFKKKLLRPSAFDEIEHS